MKVTKFKNKKYSNNKTKYSGSIKNKKNKIKLSIFVSNFFFLVSEAFEEKLTIAIEVPPVCCPFITLS